MEIDDRIDILEGYIDGIWEKLEEISANNGEKNNFIDGILNHENIGASIENNKIDFKRIKINCGEF